ncbi:YTH domain-containing protein 1-like [Etheostoma cragini]|uniref:YTH domain-containing protein 1-like n=1 Tax=Etheostoma cragini TaxID=417921 RepID=UPI00155F004B|nr:YTH domain-containing protein 1-like [Etheostoma cragini]
MAADRREEKDGELNVLEDILTEAPDQDDELYNPETERAISDKKGTKRKSERSDSRDLKRLRPSRSSSNKRGPPLSSTSKKVACSPRTRHAASYRHEYYEERKGRRGAREVTRSRAGEDAHRRDAQRGLEALSQIF